MNENSKSLDEFSKKVLQEPYQLQKEFNEKYNLQNNELNKILQDSSLQDEKLKVLIKEQASASGYYKDTIDKLINDYTKEMDYSDEDNKEIERLLKESLKVQELSRNELLETRKIENRKSPLSAFTQAFEDFKETKSVKEGGSTLVKGLKEGLNFKSITKGLMHTAGVVLDNPALNILAEKIQNNVDVEEERNNKEAELINKLNSNNDVVPSKTEEEFASKVESNKEIIDEVKTIEINKDNLLEITNLLKSIDKNISITNANIKEQIFYQKDSNNDSKNMSSSSDNVISGPLSVESNKEEHSSGILDSIMDKTLDNDSKKGKRKGRGKGRGGKFGKIGKTFSKVPSGALKVGGGLLAAGVAGYDKYTEVEDDETLSSSQKLTQVGSTATGAGAGALAGATIGATLGSVVPVVGTAIGGLLGGAIGGIAGSSVGSAIGDYASGLIGDKESTSTVNALEKQGVLETSMMGDSKIKNWDVIKNLDKDTIKNVLKYDDWDSDTEDRLKALIDTPNIKSSNTSSSDTSNDSKVALNSNDSSKDEFKNIPDVKSTEIPGNNIKQEIPAPIVNVQPAPVVVQPSSDNTKKINIYNTSDSDLGMKFMMSGL